MVFGTGPKVGEALVSHPDVPVISFTGSTATAQRIRQACSQYSKKISLEVCVIFASICENVYGCDGVRDILYNLCQNINEKKLINDHHASVMSFSVK